MKAKKIFYTILVLVCLLGIFLLGNMFILLCVEDNYIGRDFNEVPYATWHNYDFLWLYGGAIVTLVFGLLMSLRVLFLKYSDSEFSAPVKKRVYSGLCLIGVYLCIVAFNYCVQFHKSLQAEGGLNAWINALIYSLASLSMITGAFMVIFVIYFFVTSFSNGVKNKSSLSFDDIRNIMTKDIEDAGQVQSILEIIDRYQKAGKTSRETVESLLDMLSAILVKANIKI